MHKNADWNCSPDRFKLLKSGGETDLSPAAVSAEGGDSIDTKEATAPSTASAGQDGLSDIKYKVIEKQLKPLYTHIVVDLWFFLFQSTYSRLPNITTGWKEPRASKFGEISIPINDTPLQVDTVSNTSIYSNQSSAPISSSKSHILLNKLHAKLFGHYIWMSRSRE